MRQRTAPVPVCPGRPRRPDLQRVGRHLPLAGRGPRALGALLVLAAACAAPRLVGGLLGLAGLLAAAGRIQVAGLEDSAGNPYLDDAGNPYPGGVADQPDFNGYDTLLEMPSIANLSRSATSGTLVAWYKAEDSSTSLIAETGTTLAEAAAGASYAQGCPLLGTDEAVIGNGVGYWQDSGTTYGNVGTAGLKIKLVFRATGTTSVLFAKRNAAVGYQIGVDASDRLYLTIQDATGAATTVSAALVAGCWYIADIVAVRSGTCQIYLESIASGAAVDISARAATLDSATAFTVFANSAGATVFDGQLALLAMWTGTFVQATEATNIGVEFRALTGGRPQTNTMGRDAAPLNWSRNSVATLQKYNPTTDADEMYSVGPHWPRCERWRLADGTTFSGFRSELSRTNLLAYSHVSEGTWTKADAGDTTTATDGPWGVDTAEGWVADTTDGSHSRLLACTTTAAVHAAFVRVKAGVVGWVAIHDPISNKGRYYNLATGALGGIYGGAPTVSYTVDNRNGWWTCVMVWTATAAARNFTVYPAAADGDATFAGDGATPSIHFAHAQVEAGNCYSSAIRTSGATAQRLKDDLGYTITGPADQGAIVMDVVMGVVVSGEYRFLDLNDGNPGTAANRVMLVKNVAAGDVGRVTIGSTGSVTGISEFGTGAAARIGTTWRPNLLQYYKNGSKEGTDDLSYTSPSVLDRVSLGCSRFFDTQPPGPTLIRRVRVYRRYQPDMASLTRL